MHDANSLYKLKEWNFFGYFLLKEEKKSLLIINRIDGKKNNIMLLSLWGIFVFRSIRINPFILIRNKLCVRCPQRVSLPLDKRRDVSSEGNSNPLQIVMAVLRTLLKFELAGSGGALQTIMAVWHTLNFKYVS
jgi:hypothetical protein